VEYILLDAGNNIISSVERKNVSTPDKFELNQNYPNPFNPSTKITYSLKSTGKVRLTAYDVLGRKVGVLADGVQTAGSHQVTFSGSNLASGIYFYRLESSGQTIIKKMILLK
jgi:hypothetical protein